MSLIVLLAALMGGAWIARDLRPKHAVLLAPAITIIVWSIALGILVSHDVTVQAIWWPFWLSTALSFAATCYVMRDDLSAVKLLMVPALCTFVILFPYFWYGIASYPGSWFWDGFAYLATGETYWAHPRHEAFQELEPLFAFGRSKFNDRFIGSALLSVFRGVIPFGGGSQNATGYFLVMTVVTFACSCTYLARVALPKQLRVSFVALAVVSGTVLNLLWANNFDHLLALSLAPAITAFAMELRWGSKRDAAFLGLAAAALVYIYPEMAAILALPAVFILIARAFKDRPALPIASSTAIAAGVFAFALAPFASDVYNFIQNQMAAVHPVAGVDKPGTGYFPTLTDGRCFFGAVAGFYTPFQSCNAPWWDLAKSVLGVLLFLITAAGIIRRRDAISVAAVVIFLAALFFILNQRYDYGAFKILASGSYVFTLLTTAALSNVRLRAFVTVCLLIVITANLYRFDKMVRFKDIEVFRMLATAVPDDAPIEIRIKDPLLFEWAEYYLRFHKTVAAEGRFLYLPSPPLDDERVKKRMGQARYLLTDADSGDHALWSNGVYRLYKIAR